MQRQVIERKNLRREDQYDLLFWIDQKIGVKNAAPRVAANAGDFGRLAGGRDNTEPVAELVAVIRERRREATDLVARHFSDCLDFEQASSAELTTIGEHLQEACVVADCGHEACAAGMELAFFSQWIGRGVLHGADGRDAGLRSVADAANVFRLFRSIESGQSRPLLHWKNKMSVAHLQRLKNAGLKELVEGLSRYDLDYTAQHVGIQAILPCGSRLKEQWLGCQPANVVGHRARRLA